MPAFSSFLFFIFCIALYIHVFLASVFIQLLHILHTHPPSLSLLPSLIYSWLTACLSQASILASITSRFADTQKSTFAISGVEGRRTGMAAGLFLFNRNGRNKFFRNACSCPRLLTSHLQEEEERVLQGKQGSFANENVIQETNKRNERLVEG